jgi:hypothetical protein
MPLARERYGRVGVARFAWNLHDRRHVENAHRRGLRSRDTRRAATSKASRIGPRALVVAFAFRLAQEPGLRDSNPGESIPSGRTGDHARGDGCPAVDRTRVVERVEGSSARVRNIQRVVRYVASDQIIVAAMYPQFRVSKNPPIGSAQRSAPGPGTPRRLSPLPGAPFLPQN